MRVIKYVSECASAKLTVWDEGKKCILSDVWSDELSRGHGRALVQRVIDYVDSQKLTCTLTVQQYSHPDQGALDNKQLEAFYASFGFVRRGENERPVVMIREPSQELQGS